MIQSEILLGVLGVTLVGLCFALYKILSNDNKNKRK